MKLFIDIPKEFEQHFQTDKFEESLYRLSADAHLLAGLYEQETAYMLSKALKKAVSIPPHGDLIERDKINLTNFEIAMCDGDYKEGIKMLLEKIKSAPVIIPADKEEA